MVTQVLDSSDSNAAAVRIACRVPRAKYGRVLRANGGKMKRNEFPAYDKSDSKKALCLGAFYRRRRESIAPLAVERITVNNGRLFVQGEPPSFSPTEQIGRRTFPNRISLLRFSFRKFTASEKK